jgi:XTP/dITP diphosphohydrolase
VCAAALAADEGAIVRRGIVEGRIAEEGRGDNGFGYDPFFLSSELGVTFGEASLAQKERVSHRGRAFRELLAAIGTRVRG